MIAEKVIVAQADRVVWFQTKVKTPVAIVQLYEVVITGAFPGMIYYGFEYERAESLFKIQVEQERKDRY